MAEIVELPPERWKNLRRLRLEALKTESRAYESAYEEEKDLAREIWEVRTSRILFALVDNIPIGLIRYDFETHCKTVHIANIYSLYVVKEYPNQGVANQLITSVLEKIQENKAIRKVKLTVNPVQEYAVRLYQRHGFNVVGTYNDEIRIDDRYYDELIMEKYL
jgi:ribosomal protein S18 acetylase RimI-like enzyme